MFTPKHLRRPVVTQPGIRREACEDSPPQSEERRRRAGSDRLVCSAGVPTAEVLLGRAALGRVARAPKIVSSPGKNLPIDNTGKCHGWGVARASRPCSCMARMAMPQSLSRRCSWFLVRYGSDHRSPEIGPHRRRTGTPWRAPTIVVDRRSTLQVAPRAGSNPLS